MSNQELYPEMPALAEHLKEKLVSSKLFMYMTNFCNKAYVYPESVMDFGNTQSNETYYRYYYKNMKRKKPIEDKCDEMYRYHTLFHSNLHDMRGTLILQGTLNGVSYFVTEAAKFYSQLDYFTKSLKLVNNFPELVLYYKDTFTEKSNDVLALMLDDLFAQSAKYDLNLDKKELIDKFKEEAQKEKERLLKEEEELKKRKGKTKN